jgi:hypothetical protein
MATITVPQSAVREDRRLEKSAEGSSRDLMAHRWHWCADPDNAKRVSITNYARQIGRHYQTIRQYVRAFEMLEEDPLKSPSVALDNATRSVEHEEVSKTIAETRGLALTTVAGGVAAGDRGDARLGFRTAETVADAVDAVSEMDAQHDGGNRASSDHRCQRSDELNRVSHQVAT